jgi:hypothetical protein
LGDKFQEMQKKAKARAPEAKAQAAMEDLLAQFA